MITTKEQNIPYTTDEMLKDYTEYYQFHDSDSPLEARAFLRSALLNSISKKLEKQSKVTILDMGGGKQIFEQEAGCDKSFAKILNRVSWVTIDISAIPRDKMLATSVAEPTQANGAELPFGSNIFDIIFSSMAIDFMPRSSFSEVKRVIKNDGELLINFHHPSLIKAAGMAMPEALKKLHSARKNLYHKKNNGSSKTLQALEKLTKAEIQYKDITFLLNNFPAHVFSDSDEIFNFLMNHFSDSQIEVSEHQKSLVKNNSWFFAQVLLSTD